MLVPAVGPESHAASLAYFGRFGDWTVVCLEGPATGRSEDVGDGEADDQSDESGASRGAQGESCVIEASLPQSDAGASTRVGIRPGESGGAEVSVQRVRGADPPSPVFLRVDDRPAHRAEPTLAAEVRWQGEEARAIVAELAAGRKLVVRSFLGVERKPLDDVIALAGYPAAVAAYREQAGVAEDP